MGTMTRLVQKLDESPGASAPAPADQVATPADAPLADAPASAAAPSRFESEPLAHDAAAETDVESVGAGEQVAAPPPSGMSADQPPIRKSLFAATPPDVAPAAPIKSDSIPVPTAQEPPPPDLSPAPASEPGVAADSPTYVDVNALKAAEAAIEAEVAPAPGALDSEPAAEAAPALQATSASVPTPHVPLYERVPDAFKTPPFATDDSPLSTSPPCSLTPATVSASIIAIRQPFSPVAEQIRGAAARLTSMNPGGEPAVLAITSAARREGKSVFCANLALMLAEGGHRRVVVVDGDLRGAALAALLGAKNEVGWADVLRGDVPLAQAVQSTTQRGLFVLSAGRTAGSSPGELLGGRSLPESIARLRGQADYVIVDTPAVSACADATLIARACDAALLIVATGRTPETVIESAASTLRGNSIHILGAVMTACEHRSAS